MARRSSTRLAHRRGQAVPPKVDALPPPEQRQPSIDKTKKSKESEESEESNSPDDPDDYDEKVGRQDILKLIIKINKLLDAERKQAPSNNHSKGTAKNKKRSTDGSKSTEACKTYAYKKKKLDAINDEVRAAIQGQYDKDEDVHL